MGEHVVGDADEIAPGDRLVVQLEGREIGIFRSDGEYHAYLNWCPHQGGPVCEGPVAGTMESSFDPETLRETREWVREGEVLNCPWHGWEFDLTDGTCLSRDGVKLPQYDVHVDDGDLVVTL